MSLHHELTIHGSDPNSSDDRRIACAVRYVRPNVAQRVGDGDYAMRAHGKDTFGNFTPVPVPESPFAPDALALYDHIRIAQAKVMMKGASGQTEIYA